MIIANSRQRQSYSKLKPDLRQKQYNSIVEQQQQEQDSIIQWIKQNFSEQYSNCKKINKLQQLYDGIALAQIVSHFVSNQDLKEEFLNQIQIVNHLSRDRNIAVNNLNLIIAMINQLFYIVLSSKGKESGEIKMIQMAKKSIQKFTGQILIGNKGKMKNFMIQIIMLLPDLTSMIQKNAKLPLKDKKKPVDYQNQLKSFSNLSRNKSQPKKQKTSHSKSVNHPKISNSTQFNSNNNIQELSSIIGYSTQNNHDRTYFNGIHLNQPQQQKQLKQGYKSRKKSQQDVVLQQQGKSNEKQVQFKQKVQMLLDWIQTSFSIDIFQLTEPHLLLGQLVNVILSPHSKLNDNQKPIKPTHYQLGSYAVYQKSLNILTQVQRLPKSNLIQLMKQVESGKVNEITFWSLINDIYLMTKNKINDPKKPSISKNKSQQKPKSIKNPTQQAQKLPTQFHNDQNINIDNIRNQSVTQILKQNIKNTSTKLKDAPLYDEDVIRQTQLWLQQEMGLGHPLEKSKSTKNILQNPLLNGTLYAKIIQRLKIGSAKGIITPSEQKHLRSNIQNVKQQLLHRGYECARKLSIYYPTYNFYLGLLNQVKENYLSRQISNKKLIIEDKQKKITEESQKLITQQQKMDIESWLQNQFNLKLQRTNNTKFIPLNLLKVTIEGILNLNFLKETTQKIKQFNYIKLLQFFRSIGFTHYSTIKADHILNENIPNSKKVQNTRWMVLRDLKIIKGQCSNKN